MKTRLVLVLLVLLLATLACGDAEPIAEFVLPTVQPEIPVDEMVAIFQIAGYDFLLDEDGDYVWENADESMSCWFDEDSGIGCTIPLTVQAIEDFDFVFVTYGVPVEVVKSIADELADGTRTSLGEESGWGWAMITDDDNDKRRTIIIVER